jgi:hypothetical protein
MFMLGGKVPNISRNEDVFKLLDQSRIVNSCFGFALFLFPVTLAKAGVQRNLENIGFLLPQE